MTTSQNNGLRESACQSLASEPRKPESDLFGDPVREPIRGTIPAGYVSLPGTGPAGESCATCNHAVRTKRYAKCGLNKARWTHGIKTDIRLGTPACDKWKAT